jgi:hypothetical protein
LDDSVVRTNHNQAVKTAVVTMLLSLVLSVVLINSSSSSVYASTPPTITWTRTIGGDGMNITPMSTISSNTIRIQFSVSDNTGVRSIECRLDNLIIDPADCPRNGIGTRTVTGSYNSPNLMRGTTAHNFCIVAVDTASPPQNTRRCFTWTIRAGPPVIEGIDGYDEINFNRILDGASTTTRLILMRFTAVDDQGIQRFECAWDTGSFTRCYEGNGFTQASGVVALTTVLPPGPHTFRVRAVDTGTPPTTGPQRIFMWNILSTPPRSPGTTILQANDEDQLRISSGGNLFSTSIFFRIGGTDDQGILRFECSWDGGRNYNLCQEGPYDYNIRPAIGSPQAYGSDFIIGGLSAINSEGGSPNMYTFCTRAVDVSNNVDSTPACFTWDVTLGPPNTSIVSATFSNGEALTNPYSFWPGTTIQYDPGSTMSRYISFHYRGFSVDQTIVGFMCRLDSQTFVACNKNLGTIYQREADAKYSGLLPGSHEFCVKAVNRHGEDPTPVCWRWNIR